MARARSSMTLSETYALLRSSDARDVIAARRDHYVAAYGHDDGWKPIVDLAEQHSDLPGLAVALRAARDAYRPDVWEKALRAVEDALAASEEKPENRDG